MQHETINQVLSRIWLVPIVREIVNPIILLLAAGAFVFFLWGVFTFIRNAGDEAGRSEGKNSIAYGLVGLVVMFGAYGIINLALETFGLPPVTKITTAATFDATSTPTSAAPGLSYVAVLPTPVTGALLQSIESIFKQGSPAGCSDTVSSETTWSGGIAALKGLMLRCSVEVTAKFGELGFDPDKWFEFNTGDSYTVLIPTQALDTILLNKGQYLTANGQPVLDYGLIHIVHTHPAQDGLPYAPPSGSDIISQCGLLTKLIMASPTYANRWEFDVVAPDGLYVFDCQQFAKQHAQTFSPTQEPWSSADSSSFMALSSSIDSQVDNSYPKAEDLALEAVYGGTANANYQLVPSTASDTEKKQAVQSLLQLYQSIGVHVTFTPW